MFFSKISFCCLTAWDNRFQEQLILIFNIRDKIRIIVNPNYHYTLPGIFMLIGMLIVIQYVAFLNMKYHVFKTDPP